MKLLFDNNLSHKLVERLADLFPGSSHVMIEGLDEADDIEIWKFAKEKEFAIISKDSDYIDLSIVHGSPPKIIWLKIGNCKVSMIENLLRSQFIPLKIFLEDSQSDIIEIVR